MKTNIKEVNSYTRELSVEVNWDILENEFRKSFKKFRANYSIPGFRKGHVPEKMIRSKYIGSIEADFAQHSLNDYYRKALIELNINPINQAEINHLEFKEGNNLKFTAKFEVTPNIKLPNYKKKIKVKAVRIKQTDTDLDNAMLELQKKHGNIKTVMDGARNGHYIQGDFQEIDDSGIPLIGKKYDKQYICLGEGVFSGPGVLQLEGIKSDEKAKVTIDYGQGKKVNYEISVHRVEEQILPKLDDEFAKSTDKSIKSLNELKEKLIESIQASLDREFSKQVEQLISNYFVEKTKIDVPESMRENYFKNIIEELKQKNGSSESIKEDEVRKAYNDAANWNIRWFLIRNQLINDNGFNAVDEDIKKKIEMAAGNSKLPIAQVKSFYKKPENRTKLEDDIVNEKLFTHLNEFVTIKETNKTTDEIRKEKSQNG